METFFQHVKAKIVLIGIPIPATIKIYDQYSRQKHISVSQQVTTLVL